MKQFDTLLIVSVEMMFLLDFSTSRNVISTVTQYGIIRKLIDIVVRIRRFENIRSENLKSDWCFHLDTKNLQSFHLLLIPIPSSKKGSSQIVRNLVHFHVKF